MKKKMGERRIRRDEIVADILSVGFGHEGGF